jgi:hypothetical protein
VCLRRDWRSFRIGHGKLEQSILLLNDGVIGKDVVILKYKVSRVSLVSTFYSKQY